MASAAGIRAGAAYIELTVSDGKLVKGLERAEKRLKAFGEGLRNVGTKVAAVGAAAVAAFGVAVHSFSETGDALDKMSQRTGISVEALSELGFAAEQSGTDLETVEAGVRNMQRSLVEAGQGSKSAIDALQSLGLTIDQLAGLTPEQQFKVLADRISRIPDPAKRAALAMELFGKSGTKLLPLMSDGAKGIEELQQQARDLGLTISTQTAKDAAKLNDTLGILWRVLKQGVLVVGASLTPLVIDLAESITRVVVSATTWLKENKSLVVTVAKIAAVVAVAGVVLIGLGYVFAALATVAGAVAAVFAGIGTAIGIAGSGLAAIISPVGLVITAVVALAGTIIYATGAGGKALSWLGERWQDLKVTVLKAIGGIGDALAAGDIGLAAKILWLTLKMEFEKGVMALQSAWLQFKHFFIDIAYQAWYGALAAGEIVWHALEVAWIETVAFLGRAWTNFTSGFQSAWASAQTWVEKSIHELWGLLDETYDADAAKRIADQRLAEEKDQIEQRRQSALDERERKRVQDRKSAADLNEATLGKIGQDYEDAKKGLQDEYDKKMSESEKALAEARKAWEDALAEAARKRAEAESNKGDRKPPADLMSDLEDRLAGLGETLAKGISVRGTFNPAAASGLAAGHDAAERTARASEQTARNTKRLVDAAMTGGLAFA